MNRIVNIFYNKIHKAN